MLTAPLIALLLQKLQQKLFSQKTNISPRLIPFKISIKCFVLNQQFNNLVMCIFKGHVPIQNNTL